MTRKFNLEWGLGERSCWNTNQTSHRFYLFHEHWAVCDEYSTSKKTTHKSHVNVTEVRASAPEPLYIPTITRQVSTGTVYILLHLLGPVWTSSMIAFGIRNLRWCWMRNLMDQSKQNFDLDWLIPINLSESNCLTAPHQWSPQIQESKEIMPVMLVVSFHTTSIMFGSVVFCGIRSQLGPNIYIYIPW